MRRLTRGLLGTAALTAMGATVFQAPPEADAAAEKPPSSATQQPSPTGAPPVDDTAPKPSHGELHNPLAEDREARRSEALDRVLREQAQPTSVGDSEVLRLSEDKYAEMSFEREDEVFTILAEFGEETDPRIDNEDPGPLHNEIPEPSDTRDNTTYWESDFDREHYMDLLFGDGEETFQHYYETQSNGVYSVDGDVSDWVELPFHGARYGSNDLPSEDAYWNFVKDAVDTWYEDQLAQGKTAEEITEYLSQFDQRDRYDHNDNGNFDQPDGYLDNFQLVFAGEGEEAGGGVLGDDAIWSHRWYAFADRIGQEGPDGNPRGGVEIGDTGIWVGDYTVQPENGGLGVFAHEFGHNLGLPDLYDTAGGENGTAFWSVMSSGSWLGHGDGVIGNTPNTFDPWSKLQLGWLDYAVASPDGESTHTIGVTEQDQLPQSVIVPLPKEEVVTEYNTPYSGAAQWWSGADDNLNNQLSQSLDLTDTSESAQLSAKLWYDIELDYDFLHVEASTDDGESWDSLTEPITGSSEDEWTDLEVDLSDYLGDEVTVQFRYTTDGGVHHDGAMLDDIVVTADGDEILVDDVEDGEGDWTTTGWEIFDGTTTEFLGSYYLAENRQYVGYDSTLETGPYNFGREHTRPDWADHFPYQNGVLIWQWDERYEDNNTSEHPGAGLNLPVDARPDALRWDDGSVARNRLQAFDATFGTDATTPLSLTAEETDGDRTRILSLDVPEQDAVPVFDDSDPDAYWDPNNPEGSVQVAGYGVAIEVADGSPDGSEQTLVVGPSDTT